MTPTALHAALVAEFVGITPTDTAGALDRFTHAEGLDVFGDDDRVSRDRQFTLEVAQPPQRFTQYSGAQWEASFVFVAVYDSSSRDATVRLLEDSKSVDETIRLVEDNVADVIMVDFLDAPTIESDAEGAAFLARAFTVRYSDTA